MYTPLDVLLMLEQSVLDCGAIGVEVEVEVEDVVDVRVKDEVEVVVEVAVEVGATDVVADVCGWEASCCSRASPCNHLLCHRVKSAY